MSDGATIALSLSPEALEAIAQRVADILAERHPVAERPGESRYLTVDEAAELLRCNRQRVDDLLSKGALTRVKEGRRTLLERRELDAYLAGEPTGRLASRSRFRHDRRG